MRENATVQLHEVARRSADQTAHRALLSKILPPKHAEKIRRAEVLRLHAEIFGLRLTVTGDVAMRIPLASLITNHVGQGVHSVDANGPLRNGLGGAIQSVEVAPNLAFVVALRGR